MAAAKSSTPSLAAIDPEDQELIDEVKSTYGDLKAQLQNRYRPFDPYLMAMAQGFGAANPSGNFFDSLGNVAGALTKVDQEESKNAQERAALRLQLAQQELEQRRKTRSDIMFRNMTYGATGEGAPATGEAGQASATGTAGTGPQLRQLTADDAQRMMGVDPEKGKLILDLVKARQTRYQMAMNGTVFDTQAGQYVKDLKIPGQTPSEFVIPELNGTIKMLPWQYDEYMAARNRGEGAEWVKNFTSPTPTVKQATGQPAPAAAFVSGSSKVEGANPPPVPPVPAAAPAATVATKPGAMATTAPVQESQSTLAQTKPAITAGQIPASPTTANRITIPAPIGAPAAPVIPSVGGTAGGLTSEALAAEAKRKELQAQAAKDVAVETARANIALQQRAGEAEIGLQEKQAANRQTGENVRFQNIINGAESSASRQATYNVLRQIAKRPDAAKIFGVFENEDVASGLLKLLETSGKGLPQVNEIRDIFTNAGLDKQLKGDQLAAAQMVALINLELRKMTRTPGEGSISDFESQGIQAMGVSMKDTPAGLAKKLDFLNARAQFERDVSRTLQQSKMNADDFRLSGKYEQLVDDYNKKLANIFYPNSKSNTGIKVSPPPAGTPTVDAIKKALEARRKQ